MTLKTGEDKQKVVKVKPVGYDEDFILRELMGGKTRDEIADELGHKSYKGLDMHMRRKGYCWSVQKQIYEKKVSPMQIVESAPVNSKVSRIISLIQEGEDPKEVAKKVGLKDYKNMAEYMKDKGYVWSTQSKNYVKEVGEIESKVDAPKQIASPGQKIIRRVEKEAVDMEKFKEFEELVPMLKMIKNNKERLNELLVTGEQQIPRYMIPGLNATRSIYISHELGELAKSFSREKNITQKEIYDIAIIDFLKRYGYAAEIKALLKQN